MQVNGKVCFVTGALPGGTGIVYRRCRKEEVYPRNMMEIMKPSKDRRNPPCRYYGVCGGCQYQHVAYTAETGYKKNQVIETIHRLAGITDFSCDGILPSEKDYGYRCTITVHPSADGRYGFFATDNQTVIPVAECLLAGTHINDVLPGLTVEGKSSGKRLTLRTDNTGRIWQSRSRPPVIFREYCGDIPLYSSPDAFSQNNRYIAMAITETLDSWLSGRENAVFFDLYCGTGFFTILLKTGFSKRIGIDANRIAIQCAKKSTDGNTGQIIFYSGSTEKKFLQIFKRHKTDNVLLFCDPPRTGIPRDFLKYIGGLPEIRGEYTISPVIRQFLPVI